MRRETLVESNADGIDDEVPAILIVIQSFDAKKSVFVLHLKKMNIRRRGRENRAIAKNSGNGNTRDDNEGKQRRSSLDA